jgi:PAS domain S-box-containing protein
MKKALKEKQWDIILCDYKMPKFNAPSAIAVLKESNIDIPIIILSGTMGEETAVECMRLGAQDYIMKGNLSRLCPVIARELKEAKIKNRQKQAESQGKAALETLHQSEAKYRTILENMQEGYFEIDLAGNFTFVNNSVCRDMGYSSEELMGMSNRQYTDKEELKKVFQVYNKIYETGESNKEFVWQIIRKDGTKRYIDASISLKKDSSGKPIGFSGISRDITERKRAEAALRESEKYFKEITENSSDVIIITDKKGKIKYCSRSVERFTGYKPEELVGRNGLKLIHPDDVKRAVDDYDKAIRAIDSAIPNAFRIVCKDGSERYFAGLGKNLLDNPAVAGFIMNVRDVTNRKQAESQKEAALEAMRQSEEKYRTFIETIQDGYYEVDLSGKYTFVNDVLCEHLQYSKEELIGQDNRRYQTKENSKKAFQKFLEVYMTGNPIKALEMEVIRKDGSIQISEVSISLIRNAEGTPISFRGTSRDITGRKQMEEQLRQNEEKYRTIIENILEPYWENDLKGNLTFVNDAMCERMGYTREKLIGLNYQQFTDKEVAKKSFEAYNRIYRTGEPIRGIERAYTRKDGSNGFGELSISLIRDAEGKPSGFRSFSHDITERKQAEETIRQSEERYRTIIEQMEEGYFELDLAGNFTFVNDAQCINFGYPREEFIGMNYKQYADEKNVKALYRLFTGIYNTETPVKAYDLELIKKDGTKSFNEISASLIKNAQGKPIGFRGISRDVTERKRVEEVLRQSEEKYRNILETIQEGYFEVDLAGKFTFVNDAICRFYGYSKEEIMVMNYRQYTDKDNAEKLFQAFNKIYNTGEPIKELNWQAISKDGTKRYVEASASLQKDSSGKPIGFRGIIHDITERKEAEEKLLLTLESLRKAFGTTVQVMVSAVEMRDPYTAGHQTRVADIARAIATEMGLPDDKIDGIRLAGTIHDIGKLSIPAEILSKPTKLTDIEFSLIKEHSRVGYEMLKDVESPWPLAQIVYQHHERMNGSGYPRKLKGDEIIMEARIMAVADVVEAMASHRPYRPGLGIEAALEEIEKNKGIFYDNDVADACLRLFREKNYKIR